MYILKVKKTRDDAVIPHYAHDGDAAMDLYSIDETTLEPGQRCLVNTGLCIELPRNTEAQIRPRSGLALKYGITILNTPGTIDEGYRGEIGIIVINHGNETFTITKHMRIAQLLVKPVITVIVEECDNLSDTSRGEGGFGSSGIN